MKKIMTLFVAVALIASLGVGAIAGAGEDAFADAILEEQTQLAFEKAAVEFAQGNDTEGLAAEENAENIIAKTSLPFRNFMGAVNSGHYIRATISEVCKAGQVQVPKNFLLMSDPATGQNIMKYHMAVWDPVTQTYRFSYEKTK
jgi:hypothetical protein